ncbi:hypothetical protein BD310DRAFT_920126 [Dichomitus squalens]|uniref:Ser-Thr-rich glycosyl-phosphatidyl-inositol-anchored membrane family-domain-containing protein n=1 Tax=Dichomitus squalens TaxID=114155 RepID=A0A4Q9Q3S7_9APHY|nr:hypothetical protein BD310DRAFT_920126 [Dichomitus squalens]
MVALFTLALVLVQALCTGQVVATLQRRSNNPADDPKRTPSPPILKPNHITQWEALEDQTVTWDASGLNVTGLNGTILLGFVRPDTTRFVYQEPLAQNFALADEAVNIILPDLPTNNRYFLILLGDMNNTSPLFGIAGTDQNDPTNSSPPTTLPPQTITTQSATITHTQVVSTVGGAASTTTTASTTSTSSSPGSSSGGAQPSGSSSGHNGCAGMVKSVRGYLVGVLLASSLLL